MENKRWEDTTLDERIIALKKQKYTHKIVAERLGCSVSKVKSTLHKHRMTSDLFNQIKDADE